MIDYKPSRLFVSASQRSFNPTITNTPDLPAIDWSQVGQVAPKLLSSSSASLPQADTIVITWANAEWAAMQHVFCASETAMLYSDRNTSLWSGWTKFADGLPSGAPSSWDFWGEWRLVEIAGNTVMLFKSNTHLDWPGQVYLSDLIKLLISNVKPALILSIGTAGGAQVGDHIGTVRAVSAGTLYIQGVLSSSWPTYENVWTAADTFLNLAGFDKLLFPIPTTYADLTSLCAQFNKYYGSTYTLAALNPGDLNTGDASPKISNQTGGDISLLTTSTFVVGSISGEYGSYACIEMDDAIIGDICHSNGVAFGFVRNISDPVQNASLPANIKGNWGSTIYDTYGLYTSFNGALAVWAILAAL
jgi:nucleoside phosphorylase